MSCDICHGHPNCPCCSEDVEIEECELCEGEGYYYIQFYYRNDEPIEKIFTPSEMAKMPKKCKDIFEKHGCIC